MKHSLLFLSALAMSALLVTSVEWAIGFTGTRRVRP